MTAQAAFTEGRCHLARLTYSASGVCVADAHAVAHADADADSADDDDDDEDCADARCRCVGVCHMAGWDEERAARDTFFAS